MGPRTPAHAEIRASVPASRSPATGWSIKNFVHIARASLQGAAPRSVARPQSAPRAVLRSNQVVGSAEPTVKSASTCFMSLVDGLALGSASP